MRNDGTETTEAEDRALLEEVLPEARRLAAGERAVITAHSEVGRAAFGHHHVSKATGLRVYGQSGGWAADVVFDDLPVGVPRVLGTPVSQPLPTRAAALERAAIILSGLMTDELPPPGADVAVFAYHGIVVSIPRAALEGLDRGNPRFASTEVVERLLEMLDAAVELRVPEDMERLTPEGRTYAQSIFVGAMLAGIPRWPPDEPPAEVH